MKLFELQRRLESSLAPLTDSPGSEARLLLSSSLGLSYSDLVLQRGAPISGQDRNKIEGLLERRLRGEALQHILGTAHFYGLELAVTPDVLIPRPETEKLVELALAHLKNIATPQILDVGTGTGAIALALKTERPDAQMWASDISSKVLSVARKNANRLNLDIRFVEADMLASAELKTLLPNLTLLISNPPYLPAADELGLAPEVQLEPPTALFAGKDGLDIFRRLESQAFTSLSAGAHCFTELDPRNVRTAAQLASRWQENEVMTDLTGRERFLILTK